MWAALSQLLTNSKGAAVVAIIVSVSSAWSLDRSDQDQRNRENDRMQSELTYLKEQAGDIKESLARIESKLDVIVPEAGR